MNYKGGAAVKKTWVTATVILVVISSLVLISHVSSAQGTGRDQVAIPCLNDTQVQNGYLQINVADPIDTYPGRFVIGTTGGDPANPNDDNKPLLYGFPDSIWSSFTTIRIDGSDFAYGGTGGTFTQNPMSDNTYINCVWVVNNIQVTQVLTLALNPYTDRADTVEIRYTLHNLDSSSHNVGTRVFLDTMLGSNDGAPFQVPGTGAVTTEHEYTGAAIPDYWQAFDDLNNPTVISQGTLRGGNATVPDRVIFASWPDVYYSTSLWDYTITPGMSFTGDSSVGLYWNPKSLGPGDTIQYVTYYGLSGLSQSLTPPLTLSVNAPQSLSVVSNAYSPNPFTVVAYVQNVSADVITNIDLTISLPPGLSLAGSPTTQTVSSLAPNETASVSWYVTASNQTTETLLSYTVNAITTGIERTVTRSIDIPALLTVTYNANGATSGTAPIDSNSYGYNATVTVLGNTGNLAKAGYTFAGWNTAANGSGTSYAPGATFQITDNTTLYAKWAAIIYTVTYDANGATSGTAPIDSNSYSYNATVTVLGNTGNLAKAGYTFAGWNTAANGSGTSYAPGATFQITDNTTLYAQWTAIIAASIRIEPETLNLHGAGMFTAFIRLPADFNIADIDLATVKCNGAPALKGIVADDTLIVKFDRQSLVGVMTGDEVTLTVTGKLMNGTMFSGSDTIMVMDNGNKE
jgi:uncharacterized repeat protein (TIGR02543 family)